MAPNRAGRQAARRRVPPSDWVMLQPDRPSREGAGSPRPPPSHPGAPQIARAEDVLPHPSMMRLSERFQSLAASDRFVAVRTWAFRGVALVQRYPKLVALFGFVSGIASFMLVDRQEGFARFIPLLLLVSWLWLMLENVLNRGLIRWLGLELPPALLRFATQMIHQESLFFVLPFFFVTTTWNSSQTLFSGLLLGAAFVAIVDPIYYRWLAARRWSYVAYHTVTLFAVLLVALPIIFQLTTAESYRIALGASVLLSAPSLVRALPATGRFRRGFVLLGMMAALAAVGWFARLSVPPATLWLTEVALTETLSERSPGETLSIVGAEQLRANGLFAYTAIRAPRGLDERIHHVWLHDGRVVDRIALEIHGGREAGYRAWTHKQNFPDNPVGRWQVRVMTEAGQMIGTLRFRVVE